MAGARCPGWGQRPAPRKTSACSRSVSFVLPPSHTFPAQSKHRGEGARPLAQFGSPRSHGQALGRPACARRREGPCGQLLGLPRARPEPAADRRGLTTGCRGGLADKLQRVRAHLAEADPVPLAASWRTRFRQTPAHACGARPMVRPGPPGRMCAPRSGHHRYQRPRPPPAFVERTRNPSSHTTRTTRATHQRILRANPAPKRMSARSSTSKRGTIFINLLTRRVPFFVEDIPFLRLVYRGCAGALGGHHNSGRRLPGGCPS